MKKMKKKSLPLLLVFALLLTLVPITKANAKTQIRLNKTSIVLTKGQQKKLTVLGTKKSVTWSSKNRSIATVTKSGTVHAKKSGTTYVYAKVSGKTLKCKVTVKNKKSSSTEVSSNYVYVTATGSKYHKYSTCSNMKHPKKISLSEAKREGYTPCKKCY